MPTPDTPLAQLAYTTYVETLALSWPHAYADLGPGMRAAWEAVAVALEAHLKEGQNVGCAAHGCALVKLRGWQPQSFDDLEGWEGGEPYAE